MYTEMLRTGMNMHGRKLFSLLIVIGLFIVLLFINSASFSLRIQGHNEDIIVKERHQKSTVTNVILLAYMCGGSTFTFQLFKQNEQAQSWYEPMMAMYESLYSTPPWVEPLQISHYADGRPRIIQQKERDFVTKSLQGLFNCRYENLPVEILTDKLTINSGCSRVSQNSAFEKCHKNKIKGHVKKCSEPLGKHCPKYIAQSVSNQCDVLRELAEANATLSDVGNDILKTSKSTVVVYEKFRNYVKCRTVYEDGIKEKCLHHLTDFCRSPSLSFRAMKVLRLPMSWTEDLIQAIPNPKVIHLVRDPRGITISRSHTNDYDKSIKPHLRSKMLCNKMLTDLNDFRRLNEKYPGVYKRFRYEDIAENPMQATKLIYDHVGKSIPEKVETWMKDNTQANANGGKTTRKNSSATAAAWRKTITAELKHQIDIDCKDVLEQLGYTL